MIPRCQVIPQANHEVSFQIDGIERLRWHANPQSTRPFFFPLVGPSGLPLTRMGHPGAPDHDHHKSIWFAHNKVLGINFWADTTEARVRQLQWLAYQDSETDAVMAVRLGWFDGHDPQPLLEQELVAAVRPASDPAETLIELQSTFRPAAETLELGQTNFGFLAVRVAKTISAHFGGGTITNSKGEVGEEAIFGKPARWMDYSGPVTNETVEGITFLDHATNPGHPVSWHVREDGWMGAGVCLRSAVVLKRAEPLVLRYLLFAHRDALVTDRAERAYANFNALAPWVVEKSMRKHEHFSLRRA